MASKTFGDTFRGTGTLTGAPELASGIAGASWATASSIAYTGRVFSRSASGAVLLGPPADQDRIARLTFTPFALGTASGVAVFEWRVRMDVFSSVSVSLGTTRYAKLVLYGGGDGNYDVYNTGSDSDSVTGMPTSGFAILRIELSTTNTKFFCNGTLLATSTIGWATGVTIDTADYTAVSYPPIVSNVSILLVDYFNAKTETVSGALGVPAAPGDSTAPVMVGALSAADIGTTSYLLAWPPATDDVAVVKYEASFDGGATWGVAGVTSPLAVVDGVPGTTDEVRVRAADAAGNKSAPLALTVTRLLSETPPAPVIRPLAAGMVVMADDFTADGALSWSPVQQCVDPSARWGVSEEGDLAGINARRSRAGLVIPAYTNTNPLAIGAHGAVNNDALTTGTVKFEDAFASVRLVAEASIESGVSMRPPGGLVAQAVDGAMNIYRLTSSGALDLVTTVTRPTGAAVVRVEVSLSTVAVYLNGSLIASSAVSASTLLRTYFPLQTDFTVLAGQSIGVVRIHYIRTEVVAAAAPSIPLGPPESVTPDPQPGNEPDPSLPPFSDFWTQFNQTYEVP